MNNKGLNVIAENPYNSAGQGKLNQGFFNNLSDSPTVAELNRTVTSSGDFARHLYSEQPEQQQEPEPPFGSHIREAVEIVKDWTKKR